MRVRRLDNNHDWTFGQGRANYADTSDSVAQRVKTRLLSFKNDWVHDIEHGLPWFESFERPADLVAVERMIKRQVLSTHGVSSIEAFELSLDPETRKLTVIATITDVYSGASELTN